MRERILDICKSICSEDISEDTDLIESGLIDSYTLLAIIDTLEQEFHIEFMPEEIIEFSNFSCIDKMVDICRKKVGEFKSY